MERRISLYVSRRNAVTWLSCALLLAAAVLRIVLECTNAAICQNVWLEIVLPVAACILYILIVLLAGKEMFYKTAIPIWMIGLYHALQFADYNFGLLVNIFCWAILLFLAMLYTEITSGRGSRAIWLFFTNAAPPAVLLYLQREFVTSGNWYDLIPYLPDMLMGFGLMLIVFAVMAVLIFYCDIHYCNRIVEAVYRPENPISLTDNPYVRAAYDMLNVHKILMIVSAVLVALLPVYSKLLRKINTSIDVEDNGSMAAIELND